LAISPQLDGCPSSFRALSIALSLSSNFGSGVVDIVSHQLEAPKKEYKSILFLPKNIILFFKYLKKVGLRKLASQKVGL
jgi:hypothetical protein